MHLNRSILIGGTERVAGKSYVRSLSRLTEGGFHKKPRMIAAQPTNTKAAPGTNSANQPTKLWVTSHSARESASAIRPLIIAPADDAD